MILSGKEKVYRKFNKFFFLLPCFIVRDKGHKINIFVASSLPLSEIGTGSLPPYCLAGASGAGVVTLLLWYSRRVCDVYLLCALLEQT